MLPQELKYTNDHEWVRLANGVAEIGITDFAAKELGDIVYVELPSVGSTVTAGAPFGVVESVKTMSDLLAPVSGEVVAVNEDLCDSSDSYRPELVNEDAFGAAWMIRVKMSDEAELNELMDAAAYAKIVEAAE